VSTIGVTSIFFAKRNSLRAREIEYFCEKTSAEFPRRLVSCTDILEVLLPKRNNE
jgi:hypothetical protein